MTLAQFVSRWLPDFRKPTAANPLMADPTYAALTHQIEDARAKHGRVRPLERRRVQLIHDALRRLKVDPALDIPRIAA